MSTDMDEVKVWIDDIRVPPGDEWIWLKSSEEALNWMKKRRASGESLGDVMSFDHDLGGDDTTRPLVMWMCENGVFPASALVHSSNSVGSEWLVGMLLRYGNILVRRAVYEVGN